MTLLKASGLPNHNAPRLRASSREIAARGRYATLYLFGVLGLLAMCAKMGALRIPDLTVTLIVVGLSFGLAVRDSRYLPALLMVVWIGNRLVRRLIDWQLGGFESLTILSLLPLMATATLLITTVPRIHQLPKQLKQSLVLIFLPMGYATLLGFVKFGIAAVIDASTWMLPVLFLPYFAGRSTSAIEAQRVTRAAVTIAGVGAIYGLYQFAVMPPWDKLWLVESGMTSSMGRPIPFAVRVWGPMNSTGPAAAVWAAAITLGLSDARWRSPIKTITLVAAGLALLLTRVRICWLTVVFGMLVWSLLQGRRRPRTLIAAIVLVVGLVVAGPMLPGGDMISQRLASFGDLQDDNSFKARRNFAGDLVGMVASSPFGVGFGGKSSGKIAGGGRLASFDNGFGDVVYTLGVPGAASWFAGMLLLWKQVTGSPDYATAGCLERRAAAAALLAMAALTLFSAFGLAGLSGTLTWLTVGLAISATRADRKATRSAYAFPLQPLRATP